MIDPGKVMIDLKRWYAEVQAGLAIGKFVEEPFDEEARRNMFGQRAKELAEQNCRHSGARVKWRSILDARHSGMVRRTRPGISRFSDVQLHIIVRCFASPRNDGVNR
jgi:hypothetical protein